LPYEMHIQPVEPNGLPLDFKGLKASALPMRHSVPVNGWRFERNGKVLAISGDTKACDELVALSQGADLLLTECSYPDPIAEVPHISRKELLTLSERMTAGRILVVHSNREFDTAPFEQPEDGDVVEV
ncbi:MAG: hypothetical protein KC561_18570, partial [Myxococcales bacterium]|nr:hypothetical protein [Myxococcales bacterium]